MTGLLMQELPKIYMMLIRQEPHTYAKHTLNIYEVCNTYCLCFRQFCSVTNNCDYGKNETQQQTEDTAQKTQQKRKRSNGTTELSPCFN